MAGQELGQIYGEIMECAGVTFPNGRYITTTDFADSMHRAGDQRGAAGIRNALHNNTSPCALNPVLAEIGQYSSQEGWTYNPWGRILYPNQMVYSMLREDIQETQHGFEILYGLDEESRQALWAAIDSENFFSLGDDFKHPHKAMENRRPLALNIRENTGEDEYSYLVNAMRDMLFLNGNYGHSRAVQRQIEDLIAWDVSKTPYEWRRAEGIEPEIVQEYLLFLKR